MSEEIKIITLGDIFKNIETEEKAFKFKDYIRDLQQKVEQLENIRKEAIVYVKDWQSYPHTKCTTHNELKNLLNILNKGDNKNKIKGEKHD